MSDKAQRGGEVWTDEEKAAMKEHAADQKASRTRSGTKEQKAAADAAAMLEKIAELDGDERTLAENVHRIITEAAPDLAPKTWYGMPAYYRDGKVLCFFQPASKFKARYATLGFDESASLDDGDMWPTSFALVSLTPAVEKRIVELVTKAIA